MAEKNDVAMVFTVDLHCEGCAQKVRKCLKHFTGVKSVKTDLKSNRVTVTGNVDAAFVKRILEEKTKQKVDFQSPPKSDGESEKKKAEGKKLVFLTWEVTKLSPGCTLVTELKNAPF